MSFLTRWFGAAASSAKPGDARLRAQAELLKQACDVLGKTVPGLADKALAYLLDGTGESVLLELQQPGTPEFGELLGRPGRLQWSFYAHQLDKETLGSIGKAMEARGKFYASVTAEEPPLDVLIRLGKLLAAADAGKQLVHPGAPVPDWLQYLINDAVFASFNGGGAQKELEKNRPAWTIELIARLLAHEDLDETLALQEVFERKDLGSYYHDRLDGLTHAPQVADYLRTHREAAMALPERLSAAGRVVLAQRLGSDAALLNDFASLFVQLTVDGSKSVRAEAIPYLEGIVEARRLELLGELLRKGNPTQRSQSAELIARLAPAPARGLLDDALAAEASRPVQQAIRSALTRLDAASDADAVELPEPPAWQPFEDGPLGDNAFRLLQESFARHLEKARLTAVEEAERNKLPETKHKYTWAQNSYKQLKEYGDPDLRRALKLFNGDAGPADLEPLQKASGMLRALVNNSKLMQELPGLGAPHLVRWVIGVQRHGCFWDDPALQAWLGRQAPDSLDLRAFAQLLKDAEVTPRHLAQACLRPRWYMTAMPTDLLPAERVWPFFAEHPEFIDEGLGLAPSTSGTNYRDSRGQFDLGSTLALLDSFPVLPARWLPRLMELALGEGKTHRAAAQRALSRLPDIGRRIVESLGHNKSEVRIEAAEWLADLGYAEAAPELARALDRESRETVRAAFLTALERLGEDISPRLTPAVLQAEAAKGLKAKPPAGLAWFALDGLPASRWADGSPVAAEILKWWLVLACKLKEPGGNALLLRYLGLLDASSRQALGNLVLRQFIAQDTRRQPLEEGIAHAKAVAPQRYQNYQRWYQNAKPEHRQYYEANFNKSEEQVFEECKREKMSEYLGSAIGEKGILALSAHAPAHEAVALLQQYMRDHYPRRAQIEAMLEGVAAGNDPLVIQLLLGLSRRYRTASVQEKARALVQQVAQRNGWTQDQLADRTIPTSGLDERGRLVLAYGEREFVVTLDASMKSELRNAEGKVVKSLPAARQHDDAAAIKEAKGQFNTHKKELKQVIESQTARLFEAMCAGRRWPQQEWRDYLYGHPIAGRLLQRLVWLELDADGKLRSAFRPTEDGSLVDLDDNEIELAPGSRVQLGHGSLLEPSAAAAWVRHFKDYKVAPLFAQMSRVIPALAMADERGQPTKEIHDRLGWLSDTFTLRGSFTKLGYQRASAEDGGFFYQYHKDFNSIGVRVAIEFSGNTLPEENVPAALKALSFEDLRGRRWDQRALPLAEVPPVLLAEGYADYLAIAAVCSGHAPDWEKKVPW